MKHADNLDKQIIEALICKSNKIEVDDSIFLKVSSKILKNERNNIDMKRPLVFKNRAIIIAASILVIIIGGAVGANSFISKDANGFLTEKTYDKLPQSSQIVKDVGFPAKLPESLLGEFKFCNANTAGHIDGSKENPFDNSQKVIGASYKREGDESTQAFITLSASNTSKDSDMFKDYEQIKLGDKTLSYKSYIARIVPSDYKMTEEDKQNEMKGNVIFMMAGSKDNKTIVERTYNAQSLKWIDNGIYYMLNDNGYNLSKEQMIKIMQEI